MAEKLKKYKVVDHNLKHLKSFDRLKDAKSFIKKNSPKDPRLSYGLYEVRQV